jgi:hypothetical protein
MSPAAINVGGVPSVAVEDGMDEADAGGRLADELGLTVPGGVVANGDGAAVSRAPQPAANAARTTTAVSTDPA